MTGYVQPMGDPLRRVDVPYSTVHPTQTWQVDGAFTFFEGRTFPVGARGEHVTAEWTLSTVWPPRMRAQAESFLQLLRDVAQEADARLDLHLDGSPESTAIDLVAETHEIPQEFPNGITRIQVVFRQVDS